MAKNRKAAEAYILKYIDKIIPGSPNTEMYKDLFANMSDKEFDEWINNIGTGKETLVVVTPNISEYKLDVRRNLELAKELGHEFFKRIWIKPRNGGPKYLTRHKHLVYDLPIRRQAQLLIKKQGIPKNNNVVDLSTGQPTGDSKGAKVSYVGLQIMSAQGLDKTVDELIRYRGGDSGAFKAMNTLIARNGTVSQAEIEPYATGVKSTEVLHALLTAAHLENDL